MRNDGSTIRSGAPRSADGGEPETKAVDLPALALALPMISAEGAIDFRLEVPGWVALAEFPADAVGKEAPAAIVVELPLPPPEPELPVVPRNSTGHLVLVCAGESLHVRGEVATEELRERFRSRIEAAFSHLKADVQIRLNDQCLVPGEGVELSLRSVPTAPLATTPGMIAVAVIGEHWRHAYVPSSGLAAGDFGKMNLVPAEYDSRRLLAEAERLLPKLREHLAALDLPTTVQSR